MWWTVPLTLTVTVTADAPTIMNVNVAISFFCIAAVVCIIWGIVSAKLLFRVTSASTLDIATMFTPMHNLARASGKTMRFCMKAVLLAALFCANFGYCEENVPVVPSTVVEGIQPTPALPATWQSRNCICVYLRGSYTVSKGIDSSTNCVDACPAVKKDRQLCVVSSCAAVR